MRQGDSAAIRSVARTMNVTRAIVLKVASTMMFALVNAQARYLGSEFPVGEVVFFRGVFALLPFVVVFGLRRNLAGAFRTNRLGAHVTRGLFSLLATAFAFAAFARLPVADVTAIGFLSPLIAVILAWLILKEQVQLYRWSAVVVGFFGAILMLSPYFVHHDVLTASMTLGVVFAFANAICYSTAPIQIRQLTTTEMPSTIMIYSTLTVTVGASMTVLFGWRMPTAGLEVATFIGIGITGGLAMILFNDSYRYAPASVLAPFDYAALLWAFMIDYWLFDVAPTRYVVGGALIVVGAGLFVILRERQLRDRQS